MQSRSRVRRANAPPDTAIGVVDGRRRAAPARPARRSAENQLLEREKLESIGRLAGGIAHDFNNMLFAIHGYAELLAKDVVSGDPARRDPDRLLPCIIGISQTAERATALTAQLLAFSRRQVVMPKVFDVNAAVTTIEPMLRQLIGENMRLLLKLDPDAGHIRADAGQIDQIVVNLVVNARDALPGGGTITIETGNGAVDESRRDELGDTKPGPLVFLAVADDGVGMNRVTRDHIFEPFFTTKDVGKGTGLGLAMAHGVVYQAGGHIEVSSEPGLGSMFKLFFPRVDVAEAVTSSDVAASIVGVGMVLVVEDDPRGRDVTTRLLEQAGCGVLAVADGVEALATASKAPPFDVLVTDVVMPRLSGADLAAAMMDRFPLIGVVLLSGYTPETLDLGPVIARGATFVAKPVTSSRLLQAILGAPAVRQAATVPR